MQNTKSKIVVFGILGFLAIALLFCLFVVKPIAEKYLASKNVDRGKNEQTLKKSADPTGNIQKENQGQINDQQDVNLQDNTPTKQPTGNAGGNSSTTGITASDLSKHIFKNGKKGFNYCVRSEDLVSSPVGEVGCTASGLYFVSEAEVNRRRPSANATVLKFEGIATSDDVKWVLKNTDLKDGYYTYQGTVAFDEDGNNLFCFAYFTAKDEPTKEYLPHRSVKAGQAYTNEVR